MDAAAEGATEIYAKLSTNAKEFYKDGLKGLQDERHTNTQYCVIFGGVISGLIFLQAILVCVLKSKRDEITDKNVEWATEELKAREITRAQNECC